MLVSRGLELFTGARALLLARFADHLHRFHLHHRRTEHFLRRGSFLGRGSVIGRGRTRLLHRSCHFHFLVHVRRHLGRSEQHIQPVRTFFASIEDVDRTAIGGFGLYDATGQRRLGFGLARRRLLRRRRLL